MFIMLRSCIQLYMHACMHLGFLTDACIHWSELKVAEHSFAGGQRVAARVLNYTNKHGGEKSNGTQTDDFSKSTLLEFCDIWQNFYFYRILNNENFKMEVEQTNFVTHLIITVQLYY